MDDLELARERRNAVRREQYRADGGARRATNQRWKEENRERVREAGREYQKQLRLRDPEHARDLLRKSYKKHRSKRLAETKDWHVAHPGYNSMKQAEYRQKDPIKFMLRNAKNRAKELGREFNLTRADIIVPETCPVLGIELQKGTDPFQPNSPSIDRMDSSKGYVSGNVQVISWRANALKRDGTLDEFRKIVAYMERL